MSNEAITEAVNEERRRLRIAITGLIAVPGNTPYTRYMNQRYVKREDLKALLSSPEDEEEEELQEDHLSEGVMA